MAGSDDGGEVRRYRAPVAMSVFVTVFFGGGAVAVLGPLFTADMPLALALALTALVAPPAGLTMVVFWRSSTTAGPDAVVVRRLRARRTAWQDVQAIEIENGPARAAAAGTRGRERPGGIVVVYDRGGGTTTLPHVGYGRGGSVSEEAAALRRMWERRRGPDWRPLPVAEAAMAKAEARKRRGGAIRAAATRARAAALVTILVQMAVILVAVLTGAVDERTSIPGGWIALVSAGPVLLVFATVFLVSLARHRRR
ncbi:hypothetical protein ACFO4E_11555 [Nocardiopsis mangrovi]|uniref:PH domain-containing protein n=1 Tax=Nocardiopsis mangrovi TaxID=1179818 RepID=A0ABV9DX65_9ACTN